jgi:hypothetical protein
MKNVSMTYAPSDFYTGRPIRPNSSVVFHRATTVRNCSQIKINTGTVSRLRSFPNDLRNGLDDSRRRWAIRQYGRRICLSWEYSFPVAASLSRNPDRPAHREARAFCERYRLRLVFLPRRSPPSSHASFRHGSANRACFRLIMSWTKDGSATRRFLPNSTLF